jgi:hypothetical protein
MNELMIIYHFESSQNQNEEFKTACYKILYAFDSNGMLAESDWTQMISMNMDLNPVEKDFTNLDDLKSFGLRLALHREKSEVRLISVQDFNVGVEGAKDKVTFKQIFFNFGEVIIDQSKPKKKGLFGNLF